MPNADLNAGQTYSHVRNFVTASFQNNAGMHNDIEAPKVLGSTQEIFKEIFKYRISMGNYKICGYKLLYLDNFANFRPGVVGTCVPSSSFNSEGYL